MFQTIGFCNFQDAFKSCRPNNFSYEGLKVLFEHLEMLEEEMQKPIELDVIAICCEYSEYKDLKEIQDNYSDIETIDDLRDKTLVLEFEGGIIVQNY
jgi:hypothetical protein